MPKAKALKIYVEPLITKSKNDNTNSRRVVFSYLGQKEAVTELFSEVAPKISFSNMDSAKFSKRAFSEKT